ncbi:hypothetical protein PUV54_00450 [Hyphococcus flavus]|uniref:Uncharacterized protein n=1 Tax=Hyphococcus flavus TaxID=1866326 RepID=A0AAE9ZIL1_9PROT|nr:hypothetical protein [Hyphococcus flavus]WDI31656.1 hypothetical protein PUV54_00450 [Hyphococcus flavus]
MPGAPSGLIGKLSANRPVLATTVLALAALMLCVLGVRHSSIAGAGDIVGRFLIGGIVLICAPLALAGFAPQKRFIGALFLTVMLAVGVMLTVDAVGMVSIAPLPLPRVVVLGGVCFFFYLAVLSPLIRNALRLGVIAPLAALIGVAGGAGYLGFQGSLETPFNASILAIAFSAGVTVGLGVGADFAVNFARGAPSKSAAAAAGHAALAPSVFSAIAAAIFAGIVSFHANFGIAEAQVVFSAIAVTLCAAVTALVSTTAALALFIPTEQTAVDENRRRQAFSENWRPLRRLLPSTTALAACAIIGVVIVLAFFEVGAPAFASTVVFLALILAAAGIAYVSIRTSLLIVALLFVSGLFAHYLYAIVGLTLPALADRLAAMALAAIAFSQLTISWRNAGDLWRNARDITQNAMSDGLRRFLISVGASASAFLASSYAFEWETGVETAGYFAVSVLIGLLIAPVMMVALSSQTQKY